MPHQFQCESLTAFYQFTQINISLINAQERKEKDDNFRWNLKFIELSTPIGQNSINHCFMNAYGQIIAMQSAPSRPKQINYQFIYIHQTMVQKRVNQKIREGDVHAIRANLDKLREELRTLRNAKASSGSATKLAKIRGVRKNIARNLTALNRKERDRVVGKLHVGSVRRPIFTRTKLTRAFRRELTTQQKSKKIQKIRKRQSNFPVRRYGLRA